MIKIRPSSKRWGIVVGVDEYANAGEHLRNLKGCVADARRMFSTMTDKDCCGFEADHVRLLENPTYADIESAFEDLGGKMSKGDELWFYYAGHGYSERRRNGVSGYLLPSDVRLSESGKLSTHGCISHSGLRDDFIARNLVQGNITVVLFLDCCCAASVGLTDGSRGACADVNEISDGFEKSFRDLGVADSSTGDNWDIKYISFMATDKSGKAKEDATGGVFTKCLIDGLRGGYPDCSTVGQNVADVYIRAGRLGMFLGEHVPNQPPIQDLNDMMYPLSISIERQSIQEQIKQMNKHVSAWLLKMREERLIGKEMRQFAEDVVDESCDFKYAGMMRNLMRLFSDPGQRLPMELKEGALLIKAFYDLKNLLEHRDMEETVRQGRKPEVRVVSRKEVVPLSSHDRDLLADVEERVRAIDGDEIDFSDIGRMPQPEAASALDAFARKRMRMLCGKDRVDSLFSSNERASWSMKARKGFASAFEAAVYELVRDDKALSQRGR